MLSYLKDDVVERAHKCQTSKVAEHVDQLCSLTQISEMYGLQKAHGVALGKLETVVIECNLALIVMRNDVMRAMKAMLSRRE